MRVFLLPLFLFALFCSANGQHTFSIVAVDSLTGQIGSAGATCGDSVIWPGTPGAMLISDVIPGVGAIHTQAQWLRQNQLNAHARMVAGDSPEQMIDWLVNNDVEANPAIRQYGIVDFRTGHPRSAGFTGENCMDYKNHIVGPNYSIQGNILLGREILDSMEARFLAAEGTLADKLMAALEGANVLGADSRCEQYGVSSLSGFLRVARSTDRPDSLMLDINVAATPNGFDPIDVLHNRYDQWRVTNSIHEEEKEVGESKAIKVYPNPADRTVTIEFSDMPPLPDELRLVNVAGAVVKTIPVEKRSAIQLDISSLAAGTYLPVCYSAGRQVATGSSFVVE